MCNFRILYRLYRENGQFMPQELFPFVFLAPRVSNYTPRNEVRGGILESPRPSVCLSVDAWLGKMVTCA